MMLRHLGAAAIACALFALTIPAAHARHAHHHHHHYHHHRVHHHHAHRMHHARHVRSGRPAFVGLTTISTAAGAITVAADDFAVNIKGFIGDLAAAGYHPSRVHCYSLASSHVERSLHKSGHACDFNQHGWGLTDRFMYHVRRYAAKWGLRDGCTFGDCGHIDAGLGRPSWPRVLARE